MMFHALEDFISKTANLVFRNKFTPFSQNVSKKIDNKTKVVYVLNKVKLYCHVQTKI